MSQPLLPIGMKTPISIGGGEDSEIVVVVVVEIEVGVSGLGGTSWWLVMEVRRRLEAGSVVIVL